MSDAQQHVRLPKDTPADKAWVQYGYERWYRDSLGYLDRKKGFASGYREGYLAGLRWSRRVDFIGLAIYVALVTIVAVAFWIFS